MAVQVKKREIEIETFTDPTIKHIDWGDNYIEEFERSMKKRKAIVERVLKQSSASTNNDFILQLHCLECEFDEVNIDSSGKNIIISIPKFLLKQIPSPESYTRARRLVNKNGIGMPTDERVSNRRKSKERAIKKYFGGIKNES